MTRWNGENRIGGFAFIRLADRFYLAPTTSGSKHEVLANQDGITDEAWEIRRNNPPDFDAGTITMIDEFVLPEGYSDHFQVPVINSQARENTYKILEQDYTKKVTTRPLSKCFPK